jgi:hypothetical protein
MQVNSGPLSADLIECHRGVAVGLPGVTKTCRLGVADLSDMRASTWKVAPRSRSATCPIRNGSLTGRVAPEDCSSEAPTEPDMQISRIRPFGSRFCYATVAGRAADAGIETPIGCHTFRATGITDYLTNGGRIEVAQKMAGHSNAKTTGLYDRRNDDISVGEVERIGI